MTVGFATQGTTPSGTAANITGSTLVTPAAPASMATGDYIVIYVFDKPDTSTPTTPANWTLLGTVAGGGGTTGLDAGPMRVTAFGRRKAAAWSAMPAITVTSGNSSTAQAFRYTNATGYWDVAAASGSDVTADTTWSVTCDVNPGLTAGDMVLVGTASPTDALTWSAQAVTATGISAWGTQVERSEPKTTTGNDHGGYVSEHPVTTGTSSAAPVITATASSGTNATGVSLLVRLREIPAPATIRGDVFASANTTTTGSNLKFPQGIQSGDKLYLFGLVGGLTSTALTTGTGVTPPTGFALYGGSEATSDHAYSSSMLIRVWEKTADGTEADDCTVVWGGGSSASRTCWAILVVPGAYTHNGIAWNDQANLTNASVTVPAVSHTGSDLFATLGFERGSSPSTAFSATPASCTLLDQSFGSGTGTCSAGLAVSNAIDRDGSVGAGTWTTNTANSAGRVAATLVFTLARIAKTTSTTWDVAAGMSRVHKTTATTWNVRARVSKTTATTWDVDAALSRISKTTATTWDVRTRVSKATATTWNLASMISQADWPAFIAHRFANPGPEETLYAANALYTTRSPAYWHEGDLQVLNDGTTMVASHDDTIDRLYSAGPVSSGSISSMSPAQWTSTTLRVNTGFSGTARPAMFISEWVNLYGKATGTPAVGLWENKSATDINDSLAALAGCQGTVIINSTTLADVQAAIAAGFEGCLQTNSPTFSQFTSNGIKYLAINYTSMTEAIADDAIAAGVKVLMYTVNSTANRDSMLALFSDASYAGFISNNPWTLAGTTRISKTTATTWNVRSRVAKTTVTTWDVRSRVAKTTSTTWDVDAFATPIVVYGVPMI